MSWFTKTADALSKAAEIDELEKAALSSKERDALPASDFIFPATREYPYQDVGHARNALSRGAQNETGARLATIKRKVHARYPDIGDITKAEFSYTVPLRKTEREGVFVGVVLEPGLEDSQGDVFSPAEIEKSAHQFMLDYSLMKDEHGPDVQHSGRDAGAHLLESYVAPQDMVVGSEPVTKASWVQAWKIDDPLVKQEVDEGKLTGLSLEGLGFRHPVEV